MPNQINVDQLLIDLRNAATAAEFEVQTYGQVNHWSLYGFIRRATGSHEGSQQVYISSGIHGDEPVGPLALLELLRNDALPRDCDLWLCPLMNPAGLAADTRENPQAIDLNRDYTDFVSPEIAAHRDWGTQHIQRLDLALHLHEDWESTGFYLYELNFDGQPSRSPAILKAVGAHLPIETARLIDDHPARDGIIRPQTMPEVPEGLPEALYFKQHFGGINHTLETPSSLPLAQRLAGMQAAVLAAIGP